MDWRNRTRAVRGRLVELVVHNLTQWRRFARRGKRMPTSRVKACALVVRARAALGNISHAVGQRVGACDA